MWEDNIKLDVRDLRCNSVRQMEVAQNMSSCRLWY
jgi:hypothetical protein